WFSPWNDNGAIVPWRKILQLKGAIRIGFGARIGMRVPSRVVQHEPGIGDRLARLINQSTGHSACLDWRRESYVYTRSFSSCFDLNRHCAIEVGCAGIVAPRI